MPDLENHQADQWRRGKLKLNIVPADSNPKLQFCRWILLKYVARRESSWTARWFHLVLVKERICMVAWRRWARDHCVQHPRLGITAYMWYLKVDCRRRSHDIIVYECKTPSHQCTHCSMLRLPCTSWCITSTMFHVQAGVCHGTVGPNSG